MTVTTAVMGDGTTAATRARTGWRRARGPLGAVALVLGVGLLTSLLGARTSTVPLAPDNPREGGGRAVAEVLRDRGVRITYVRTVAEATAAAQAGTTLLVADTAALMGDQVDAVAAVPADLVVVSPEAYHLSALTDGAVTDGGPFLSGTLRAECDDADALAAGEVAFSARSMVTTDPDVAVCFPATGLTDAEGRAGGYVSLTARGRRVVLLADPDPLTNEHVDDLGHAALVLRALGRHDHLVWYVPSLGDLSSGAGDGDDDGAPVEGTLPSWFGVVGLQLLVVVLALALWRGRRLGPVVTEPLPVVVRAAEATVGRGRLYRRARARGHAAAALRAGAAHRAAARLGLPRNAGAPEVIDALSRATGRRADDVAALLYGPPPTDDAGLLQLARTLDQLESEVHRT